MALPLKPNRDRQGSAKKTIFVVVMCSCYLHDFSVHGNELILLPHDTISVCLGEQLIFMCNTNATSLRWNITVPLVNGIGSEIVSHTQTRMISPIRINSDTSLTISRHSTNATLPLMSTLSVNNVTVDLNGTNVECFTRINGTGLQMVATIHVIRSGSNVFPHLLELNSTEVFRANSVSIFLEWKEEPGVTYTANASPPAPLMFSGNARIQLTLSYNVIYKVNITATLCGQNSINTTINLSYTKCSDTFVEVLIHSADRDIFLEGTNVTFTCPPGLVLIGSDTSICMGNGEWEPNPNEVECKVHCGVPLAKSNITLIFNSTLEGAQLVFWCDESPNSTMTASCLRDGRWSIDIGDYSCAIEQSATISRELIISLVIAMASSIIFLTSVFFIIFGCIYGRSWQKRKQSKEISDIKDAHLPAEQDLEMTENVSYGPLKWTTTK